MLRNNVCTADPLPRHPVPSGMPAPQRRPDVNSPSLLHRGRLHWWTCARGERIMPAVTLEIGFHIWLAPKWDQPPTHHRNVGLNWTVEFYICWQFDTRGEFDPPSAAAGFTLPKLGSRNDITQVSEAIRTVIILMCQNLLTTCVLYVLSHLQ